MRTPPRAERHACEIPATDAARAAIYVRVSTKDQTTENQERELRQWTARLGLEVVAVYTDTASGARSDRAALTEVLTGAHRREFRVLLVWALDRLSREGIGPMLHYLEQLCAAGVRVMSHQESWVDTASPVWELLVRSSPGSRSKSASGSANVCGPARREPASVALSLESFDGVFALGCVEIVGVERDLDLSLTDDLAQILRDEFAKPVDPLSSVEQ